MKKAVIVKKSKIVLVIWICLNLFNLLFCSYVLVKYHQKMILLFMLPFSFACTIVALYCFLWQVTINKSSIDYRKFYSLKQYQYCEIKEATERFSFSENGYVIQLKMADGSAIRFSSHCSNYSDAKKALLKHISINQPIDIYA